MKITVIIPTYNDAKSIRQSLLSLFHQTDKDWELIIVDDGSTDNTQDVVQDLIAEYASLSGQIHYLKQANQDQLTAILTALPYVTGDYIYILHSDDYIPEINTFEQLKRVIQTDPEYDAYIGNWYIMDEFSQRQGVKKVMPYKNKDSRLALLYLWLGRNLYVDVGLFRTSTFLKNIKESYLTWNMPFWVNFQTNQLLKVKNVDFIMYEYRVFSGNYANTELGQLNVINGELRTLVALMKTKSIPLYKWQFILFRLLNKLGLSQWYTPIYFNQKEKHPGKVIEFAVRKRFGEGYKTNLFLNSLVSYYKQPNQRILTIKALPTELPIYYGKDMRIFNQLLIEDNLPAFYQTLLLEMSQGFSTIQCKEEDLDKLQTICRFFCIQPEFKVF
ncbi:glycosyltransferase family 2 protein [Enterococcus lemanii]|uniref:Glycosyltransferase family 2 protein n=1 Tax=Enterococcus lemanii TaxID=1159752 RepID=A0ABV9MU12_9ENTE|nr:glycosyltransferase [Enterococcus lemanii]MBM7709073.1 glycosyltransferase involved in cell wall biosynthesis [Enterococcus lemanii]